jgi:hypothetical protein
MPTELIPIPDTLVSDLVEIEEIDGHFRLVFVDRSDTVVLKVALSEDALVAATLRLAAFLGRRRAAPKSR